MTARQILAQHLRDYRKKHMLTQKELGERLGINNVMISNYEVCKSTPTMEHLIKIANHIGFNLNELQKETALLK